MPDTLEAAVLDEWHVVCAYTDIEPRTTLRTRLLDTPIAVIRDEKGDVTTWRDQSTAGAPLGAPKPDYTPLPQRNRYGYVWTSLGAPSHELFDIPEAAEPDRRLIHAGSFGVHTSAPRAVENFLDMGHFPFVHGGYLGAEPHTEVKDYEVSASRDGDELIATRCRFFQPIASLAARDGFEVEYVYRVPHPYCCVLYKSCAVDANRDDVIAIFARPVTEERIVASLFMALLDHEHGDLELRQFQQLIFGQDKPVLENQRPRRLPLDPTVEVSVKADRSSVAYRRWLRERGVRYGTVAAP